MGRRVRIGNKSQSDMKFRNDTNKSHPKLRNEYDKLHPKQRKEYIISHDGFEPNATAQITFHASVDATAELSMSSANGKIVMCKGVAGSTNTSTRKFKSNGTITQMATGVRDIVNVNAPCELSASSAAGVLTVHQVHPGPDGNTTITTAGTWTSATVPSKLSKG